MDAKTYDAVEAYEAEVTLPSRKDAVKAYEALVAVAAYEALVASAAYEAEVTEPSNEPENEPENVPVVAPVNVVGPVTDSEPDIVISYASVPVKASID